MVRGLIIGTVLAVVFVVAALADASTISRDRVRSLPRWTWILIILFIPVIGAILWFMLGRERAAKNSSGRTRGGRNARGQSSPRVVAPDDDIDFLRSLNVDRPDPNNSDPENPENPENPDEPDPTPNGGPRA